MIATLRRAAQVLRRASGWQSAEESLDHGHAPYAAWEAELSAYARHRTGLPLKVHFAIAHHAGWADEIALARSGPGVSPEVALRRAELELEHELMHCRHGWRELALLWHVWAQPAEEVRLPWPPWDRVTLPTALVRSTLARTDRAFALPAGTALASERVRCAARWVAAAWCDGVHRSLELQERPGLEDRLPPPPSAPSGAPVWLRLLHALAAGGEAIPALSSSVPDPIATALLALGHLSPDVSAGHVPAVVELSLTLGDQRLLPPGHRQRPAWLRPTWGRWHLEDRLQAALDEIARSPESAAYAAATTIRRASGFGSGRFGIGSARVLGSHTGRSRGHPEDNRPPALDAAPPPEEIRPDGAWGVVEPESTPRAKTDAATDSSSAEGSGTGHLAGGQGAGAGHLGALHIVKPSPEDRAAYWQLRGALGPEIERLIGRLIAAGALDEALAPKRFRRHGRLDRARLHAALSGREAVFSQFVHAPAPEHALCLLLDCSASMTRHAERLREMAIVCEAAAAAVGARVTAFSFGPSWERMEPPAHRAPLTSLGRELHPHGGTPFGPALQAAAQWLAVQPYAQKRLWVFSDGQWSERDRAGAGWRPEWLENVVVWVLDETAPEPPHPAMRVVAVPEVADLVLEAPRYFWLEMRRLAAAAR